MASLAHVSVMTAKITASFGTPLSRFQSRTCGLLGGPRHNQNNEIGRLVCM